MVLAPGALPAPAPSSVPAAGANARATTAPCASCGRHVALLWEPCSGRPPVNRLRARPGCPVWGGRGSLGPEGMKRRENPHAERRWKQSARATPRRAGRGRQRARARTSLPVQVRVRVLHARVGPCEERGPRVCSSPGRPEGRQVPGLPGGRPPRGPGSASPRGARWVRGSARAYRLGHHWALSISSPSSPVLESVISCVGSGSSIGQWGQGSVCTCAGSQAQVGCFW